MAEPEPTQDQQHTEQARHHALRAHQLLDAADAETGNAGVTTTVPARATHRVNLALAHAQTALALSSLAPTLPAQLIAPPPPPTE